jgi:hypothetical protein
MTPRTARLLRFWSARSTAESRLLDELDTLVDEGFTFSEVARVLGVPPRNLRPMVSAMRRNREGIR